MRLLTLILLLASLAHSQPIDGMDYLGIARFCPTALKYHNKKLAIGLFTKVDGFGDALPCLRKFCAAKKAPAARVHLVWKDAHGCADAKEIEQEAKRLEPVAKFCKSKGVPVYVSGHCEHECNATTAKIHRAKALGHCKSCAGYINTPWRGAKIDGLNELHGQSARGVQSVSYDGHPMVDADVSTWLQNNRKALFRFAWEPLFNGRCESTDSTPRPQRKCWPKARDIRGVAYLFNDKGTDAKLPPLTLYKSHAENHGTGDRRAERPVVILRDKARSISLVAGGRTAETCSGLDGRGQNWAPMVSAPWSKQNPGWRYYCPRYGYEIAQRARQISSKPVTQIAVGKKVVGEVNPAFRAGSFR